MIRKNIFIIILSVLIAFTSACNNGTSSIIDSGQITSGMSDESSLADDTPSQAQSDDFTHSESADETSSQNSSIQPTNQPTNKPTSTPTGSPGVTKTPTLTPVATPTIKPSATPTSKPVATPTMSSDDPLYGYKPNTYAPLGKNVMPLGAWISPPPANYGGLGNPNYITNENYKTLAESGLNFIQAIYERADLKLSDVMMALDFAHANGIKYLVRDQQAIAGIDDIEVMEQSVARYMNEPAFLGNMIYDEPSTIAMTDLGSLHVNYKKSFPNALFYINLLPTYASKNQLFISVTNPGGGASTRDDYYQYLNTYIGNVKPRFLSYDYYPCEGTFPNLKSGYYDNLSIIREVAMDVNIPFWVFIQTCSFGSGIRNPNKEEINWQVNTALAYGSKGIQYFTYWSPIELSQFSAGMVTKTGEKTQTYYNVQAINNHIKAIDDVLMNSTSMGLISTGTSPVPIPQRDLISSYRQLSSVSGTVPVLTGCFNNAGADVYYVVNNSINQTGSATLNFKNNKKYEIIQKGIKREVTNNQITINLDPGEGVLIKG